MEETLDVEYDENYGWWCVFRGERAIASFCSKEEADSYRKSAEAFCWQDTLTVVEP